MTTPRTRHKSTRKQYAPIELTLDTTPEGIVAFSKYMIGLVGSQKIDTRRASCVNGWVQTILRTNDSGIDAVKDIEKDSVDLAQAVRAVTRLTSKPAE